MDLDDDSTPFVHEEGVYVAAPESSDDLVHEPLVPSSSSNSDAPVVLYESNNFAAASTSDDAAPLSYSAADADADAGATTGDGAEPGQEQKEADEEEKPPVEQIVPIWKKLAWGAPGLAHPTFVVFLIVYVVKYHADVIKVPQSFLSVSLAISLSVNAILDPIVGWASDNATTRLGRRRPFLLMAAPMMVICLIALIPLVPPFQSDLLKSIWFFVFSTGLLFSQTAYQTPWTALGFEMTHEHKQRNQIFMIQQIFNTLGLVSVLILPPMAAEFFGYYWAYSAWSIGISTVFVIGVAICVLFVRTGSPRKKKDRTGSGGVEEEETVAVNPAAQYERHLEEAKTPYFVAGLIRCLRVKPYRIFMAGLVVYNVKIDVGLIIYSYFQTVIHATALVQSLLYCMLFASSFLSAPILAILSNKIGKSRAFITALVICLIAFAGVTFAWAPWDPFNLLYFALIGFDNTTTQVINSILADICDYDTLHSGAKREAQFQSMTIVMDGFARILPNSIPLAILYFLGYDPDVNIQNEKVVLGLKGMMGVYNCIPLIIAGIFLFFFPLDVKKHRKILIGIAAHKRGEAAIDPLTNRLVHPATNRIVSEEHGWFLDQWFKPELSALLRVAGRNLKKFPFKSPKAADEDFAAERKLAARGTFVLGLLVFLQWVVCVIMLGVMIGISVGLCFLGPLFIIFVSIPVAAASMFFGFGVCNMIRLFYVFRLGAKLRKGDITLTIIENHVRGTRTVAPIGGGQPIVIPTSTPNSKAKQRKLAVTSPKSNIDTQPMLGDTPN